MTYSKGTKVSFDVEALSTSLGTSIGCQTFTPDELLDALHENGETARISGRVTGKADGNGNVLIGAKSRAFRESQIHDVARNLTTEAPEPELTWQDGDSLLFGGELRYRHNGEWFDTNGTRRNQSPGADEWYTGKIGSTESYDETVPLVMGGKPWRAPVTDLSALSWQEGDRVSLDGETRTRRATGVWVIDTHGGTSSWDDGDWDRRINNGSTRVLRKGGVDFPTTGLATAA